MKKLLIPLSLMALAMIPTGCSLNSNNNANVTMELSKNLTELINSAKKVTDIDESKLMINELNNTTDINQDYNQNTNNTYKAKIKRNITKDSTATNNKYYREATFNRNSGPLYTRFRGKTLANSQKTAQNSTFNNNNTTNQTYTKNINNSNNVYKSTNNTQYPEINNTSGNYVTDGGTTTNRYYNSKYNPRFVDTMTSSNTALTNYLEKIQDLYTICNDTCAASNDLDSLKSELISTCQNCNSLLKKVKSGEVTLTPEQTKTLGEYNKALQSCIDDLNSCKDCSEDVKMINALKGNFSNNCDTLVAKYLKVLNNLDTNGNYCNNAQCTVSEINNYISSLCGESVNNYVSRYRFDSYDIDKEYLINDNSNQTQNSTNKPQNNSNNTNQTNNQTSMDTSRQTTQNTQNKAQNTTQNGQSNQSSTQASTNKTSQNTQINGRQNHTTTTTQTNKNYQTTPARPVVNNSTNAMSSNSTQNATSSQSSQTSNRQKAEAQTPSTYPMQNPANTNRFVNNQNTTTNNSRNNVYGGNNPKVNTQNYDTPNRHPLTKDIKQNPNTQTEPANTKSFATQNNERAREIVTYNNRYDNMQNVSTPSPQKDYRGVSALDKSIDRTSDYRTNNRKVATNRNFTNSTLRFGPQNVRANNDIMTLEEI